MSSDAKFGIEIETIVLDPPTPKCKLLPFNASIIDTCDNTIVLTDPLKRLNARVVSFADDDIQGSIELRRARRCQLGKYIKTQITNGPAIKCCYTDKYHGSHLECEDPSTINKQGQLIGEYWLVDHDGSVGMNQENTNLACAPYRSLATITNRFIFKAMERVGKGYNIVENMEIVSPPFKIDDFTQVDAVFNVLKTYTPLTAGSSLDKLLFFNNSTTSQHIHMSMGDMFKSSLNVLKICIAWWWYEPIIMSLVPFWRRGNNYCISMREFTRRKFTSLENPLGHVAIMSNSEMILHMLSDDQNYTGMIESLTSATLLPGIVQLFQGDSNGNISRYAALNLMNLLGRYGTIEVRIKHGSVDGKEIKQFVTLFHNFFDSAMKMDLHKFNISEGNKEFLEKMFYADYHANKTAFDEIKQNFKSFVGQDSATSQWIDAQIKKCNETYTYVNAHSSAYTGIFRDALMRDAQAQADAQAAQAEAAQEAPAPSNASAATAATSRDVPLPHGGAQSEASVTSVPKARKYKVFMYGSNSSKQVCERCGIHDPIAPISAYIEDHARIFAGWSTRWKGSIASVFPKKGAKVFGSVFKLTMEQILQLDEYEGGYIRERKTVMVMDDGRTYKPIKCYIYIKTNFEYSGPPSHHYLNAIKEMLHETSDRKHTSNIVVRGMVKNKKNKWVMKTMGTYNSIDGVLELVMHDHKNT